jgi:hypothetical protein
LSATVVAVAWLNVPFGWTDVLGSLCIVLTMYVLARSEAKSVDQSL